MFVHSVTNASFVCFYLFIYWKSIYLGFGPKTVHSFSFHRHIDEWIICKLVNREWKDNSKWNKDRPIHSWGRLIRPSGGAFSEELLKAPSVSWILGVCTQFNPETEREHKQHLNVSPAVLVSCHRAWKLIHWTDTEWETILASFWRGHTFREELC